MELSPRASGLAPPPAQGAALAAAGEGVASSRAAAAPAVAPVSGARELLALCKPGIVLSNAVAAAAGSALSASAGDGGTLVALFGGTALLVASSGVWNMLLERHTDARMARTRGRPLAAGRVPLHHACVLGSLTLAGGVTALGFGTTPLCLTLGLLAVGLYALVYTPLKRRSPWSLAVGAVAGALPPLLGGAAVSGGLEVGPLWCALWVFLWQFPHFLALAAARQGEYRAAGLRVLPVAGSALVFRLLLLVPAALLPLVSGVLALGLDAGAGGASLLVVPALPLALAVLRAGPRLVWWGALDDVPFLEACRRLFFSSLWSLCLFVAACLLLGSA